MRYWKVTVLNTRTLTLSMTFGIIRIYLLRDSKYKSLPRFSGGFFVFASPSTPLHNLSIEAIHGEGLWQPVFAFLADGAEARWKLGWVAKTEDWDEIAECYYGLTGLCRAKTECYQALTEHYHAKTRLYQGLTGYYHAKTEYYHGPTEHYHAPTEDFRIFL